MGWASASSIVQVIIEAVQKHVPDETARREIYKPIIEEFEAGDWDTQDECEGQDPAFDAALRDLHPRWYEGR